jgi:hypothetical protein
VFSVFSVEIRTTVEHRFPKSGIFKIAAIGHVEYLEVPPRDRVDVFARKTKRAVKRKCPERKKNLGHPWITQTGTIVYVLRYIGENYNRGWLAIGGKKKQERRGHVKSSPRDRLDFARVRGLK